MKSLQRFQEKGIQPHKTEPMKALVFRKYGSPDSLEIQDVETPRPADDQVLVKVKAVSVNDWDWGLLCGTPFFPIGVRIHEP